MNAAALPCRAEHHFVDRLPKTFMGVGDHQTHTGETAGAQRPQEARPERLVLGVADSQAENFAVAVSSHTGGHDDRFRYDPGAFMGLHVGRVQEDVGELDVIEAAFAELVHRAVELGADAADLTLGDTGIEFRAR